MKILDDQELNNLNAVFNEKERLLIHQLRLLEWLSTRNDGKTPVLTDEASKENVTVPELWQLTKDITLYPWQKLCITRWLEANGKGTVKVVTGGGKTLLALALAEKLQNSSAPELCVAVVVPTIVLMHQWYDELLDRGNIPPGAIGRLGGGYKDDFSGGRRILISVLATACKELPKIVEQSNVGGKLLLVADECHRFGAKEMSQIFATKRVYSLGLSATPERDDEADDSATSFDESLLGKELGSIIYDFTLKEALDLGIVPSFSIHHYGLSLLPDERHKYDRLSRSISEAQSELKNSMGKSSLNFFQWVRGTAQRGGPLQHRAIQFIGDTSRRKELVYGMTSRITAVEELIRNEFSVNPDSRVILFHESINEVMRIFLHLKNAGFPVIAEHSELPNTMREAGLELFRNGTAQIIVSAKSLIEGFNVPAVDVGIIVASSSSVRQRIQSLGRVLRKHRSASGEEKTSCIHVLYAANTVDDAIYGREDWERFTGVDRNYYYLWPAEQNPIPQEGPPRLPLPNDAAIDVNDLTVGGIYPGQYEGEEYSVDTRGNITDASERHVVNASHMAPLILKVKGCAGRFRVTPRKRYVLVYLPEGDVWVVKFVTQLDNPFQFELAANNNDVSEEAVQQWLATAQPGDIYPFAGHFEKVDEFGFSQRRGGLITKKIRGGELYARCGGEAENPIRGGNAQTLLSILKQNHREGHNVSKFEVNTKGHVLFRKNGQSIFLVSIPEGIEFPELI